MPKMAIDKSDYTGSCHPFSGLPLILTESSVSWLIFKISGRKVHLYGNLDSLTEPLTRALKNGIVL